MINMNYDDHQRNMAKKEEEEMRNGAKEWECNIICGSPLYDAYELVSVANIIDRHMMVFPSTATGGFQPSSSLEFHEDHEEICIDKLNKKMIKKKKNVAHHRRMKNGKIRGIRSGICSFLSRIGLIVKK